MWPDKAANFGRPTSRPSQSQPSALVEHLADELPNMWCQWSLEVTAPQDATSQRNLELNVGPGVSSQHDWNSVWHFEVTNSDRNTRRLTQCSRTKAPLCFIKVMQKQMMLKNNLNLKRFKFIFGSMHIFTVSTPNFQHATVKKTKR